MIYDDAIAYLNDLSKFGIQLGLQRIETLLELMGHPEQQLRIIHVGGTNGKGSTVSFLTSILVAAGYQVGTYTSPHLCSYTERIALQGRPIDCQEFADIIASVQPVVEQAKQQGCEQPTEFEVLTAGMFQFFAQRGVDFAVVEVGLGGRYDSTNAIHPLLSVITNVQFDHTDRCGPRIEDIAWHKAGIIKHSVPVVTGAVGDALTVIKTVAAEQHAALTVMQRCVQIIPKLQALDGQTFSIIGQGWNLNDLHIGLLGRHQLDNAAIALMAIGALRQAGVKISEHSIREGFIRAVWPGRLEVWGRHPVIILDGAHNKDGAAVLAETLRELFPDRSVVFMLGILKDKDIPGIISCLEPLADTIVVTEVHSPRTARTHEIAMHIQQASVLTCPDIQTAVSKALNLANADKPLCICGSLYLLQDVYAALGQLTMR